MVDCLELKCETPAWHFAANGGKSGHASNHDLGKLSAKLTYEYMHKKKGIMAICNGSTLAIAILISINTKRL
jgi:hypothetical protein